MLKAIGLTDNELEKPLIAIVSAFSEISPSLKSLNAVVDAVKAGIYAGGCTPVVIPAIGVCNGLAMGGRGLRYALPSRELVADGVETVLAAHAADGAVFVSDEESTTAGMLMGAARVNIPSIFVAGGPSESGGDKSGFAAVYKAVGAVKNGAMNIDELSALENTAYPCLGSDCALTTSNALGCVTEALGIALPGNGTALAGHSDRIRLAKKTGLTACELVREAITLKMVITKRALTNAFILAMAIGAGANTVLHLFALAEECNIAVDYDFVQKISDGTPLLCDLTSGKYDMRDFGAAGGVMAALKELARKNLIDGSAHTVCGDALADHYDGAQADDECIKHADEPLCDKGSVAVVKGNLAEDGALVRRANIAKPKLTFSGKAKCFDSEEDAVIAAYSGKIKSGDVVVVRYEGPAGGPGMRELSTLGAALYAIDKDCNIALVTDGRISTAIPGIAVGHVAPEAAVGGKIALVKDGDMIKIDVPSGRLALDVPAKELAARQKKLRPKDGVASGWLLRYQNTVTSAANGATLKKRF